MDLHLKGQHVLVTGGSKGIGAACAKVFLQEGCAVTIVARDAGALERTRADLAGLGSVAAIAADLSRGEERERIVQAVPAATILVNNAGAIPSGGLLDLTMERWADAWNLKVMGYIHLTQLMLLRFRERKAGVIVNIIGTAGRSPRYDYICGGTGNAALMAFTGAIGAKSVDWGIRVFGVNPAITRTERMVMQAKVRAKDAYGDESRWEEMLVGLPLDRAIEPDEIANAAAFLASPACGYVSGTVLDVDGGGHYRAGK